MNNWRENGVAGSAKLPANLCWSIQSCPKLKCDVSLDWGLMSQSLTSYTSFAWVKTQLLSVYHVWFKCQYRHFPEMHFSWKCHAKLPMWWPPILLQYAHLNQTWYIENYWGFTSKVASSHIQMQKSGIWKDWLIFSPLFWFTCLITVVFSIDMLKVIMFSISWTVPFELSSHQLNHIMNQTNYPDIHQFLLVPLPELFFFFWEKKLCVPVQETSDDRWNQLFWCHFLKSCHLFISYQECCQRLHPR